MSYLFFREKDCLLKLAAIVNLRGFDVIIENCAEENLSKDFTVLARNGRIAVSKQILFWYY